MPLWRYEELITRVQQARLEDLIAAGQQDKFYSWSAWRRIAAKVKAMDNWECQHCKAHGRYARGEVVHHVKHLIDRPDLALSIYDPETGERQLETLCWQCHDIEHPEKHTHISRAKPPLTTERWD